MNTESRRKAARTYAEKRRSGGDRKVTFLLSAAAIEKLDKLAEKHGSKAAALEYAISEAPMNVGIVKARDVVVPVKAVTGEEWVAALGYDPGAPTTPAKPLKASSGQPKPKAGVSVQLGPTPRKPGEGLKKPKVK